jgi:hypothetical protein
VNSALILMGSLASLRMEWVRINVIGRYRALLWGKASHSKRKTGRIIIKRQIRAWGFIGVLNVEKENHDHLPLRRRLLARRGRSAGRCDMQGGSQI